MQGRRYVCAIAVAVVGMGSAAAAWDMAIVRALGHGRWTQVQDGLAAKDLAAVNGHCGASTIIFDVSESQIVLSRFDGPGAPTRADFYEDARAQVVKGGGTRIDLFLSLGDPTPATSFSTEGAANDSVGSKVPVLDEHGADGAVTARWAPCAPE